MLPIAIFYQVYAYLSLVLSAQVFYMQMRARNLPCLLLLFWVCICTFIYVVQSAIWHQTSEPKWLGYGFCDITSRIITCASIGVPAAAFTLVLYLDKVIRSDSPLKPFQNWIFQILLSLVYPLVTMLLMIPMESNRYVVICMNGCMPAFYQTVYTLIIFYLPPCLLSLGGLFFVSRILYYYWHRQKELQQFFQRDSQLTSKRFLRLLLLDAVFFLGYFPLTIYLLISNCKGHKFMAVDRYFISLWHQVPVYFFPATSIFLNNWIPPTVLIVMSIFFITSGKWTDYVAMFLWSLVVRCPFIKNTSLGRHAQFKLDSEKSAETTLAERTIDSGDLKEKCLILERQWSKLSVPSDDSSESQTSTKYV
ncbi:pheromone M-factor receptor Map3 [Schizosaccharomyces osmophilus]|uniref:Pheromone M-factor receptor Map3 n=1 Tax=Schizosaccharomyces osmophilus TaxID=2545709 RepID=A0AAF0AUM8_9SCHI|nr:pheromone M-factor receptor Map3 [Schizosaccharomyces osmophilus]WBW71762.1 pheromone M-factor receptor Map3 [Schizosaccharomyces osmophilus]